MKCSIHNTRARVVEMGLVSYVAGGRLLAVEYGRPETVTRNHDRGAGGCGEGCCVVASRGCWKSLVGLHDHSRGAEVAVKAKTASSAPLLSGIPGPTNEPRTPLRRKIHNIISRRPKLRSGKSPVRRLWLALVDISGCPPVSKSHHVFISTWMEGNSLSYYRLSPQEIIKSKLEQKGKAVSWS